MIENVSLRPNGELLYLLAIPTCAAEVTFVSAVANLPRPDQPVSFRN